MKDGMHPSRYVPIEPKKQTNADRIRSMSDEELAEMLMCPAEYDINFRKTCDCRGEMNRNCFECTKKWLQSEAEETDEQ